MFSHFFIKRPIFAGVISIVIVLLGSLALTSLPIARYPDLAPPTVNISTVYPGANASVVAETVAAPIEEEVNGVEGMLYMQSVSANDGSMSLTVTFESGTDLDIANVLVQNRVAVAEASLPEEVKRMGVTVKKRSTDIVLYAAIYSPDDSYSDTYLSNYLSQRMRNELARVPGVGDVQTYGTGDYSMRVWLDPQKLKGYDLSAEEVVAAIREQNVQVAAGTIGGAPAASDTAFEYVVNARGRLVEEDEFGDIVIRTSEEGAVVRIRDVARVELGAETYNFVSQLGGKPSATLAIYQIPGSNVIAVAEGVRAKLEELKAAFPKGLDYSIVYDATDVITASIKEVVETLFITLILVVLTVYIFLQDFRATIIPAVTIPVSLIGTFAAMLALGYSINILTLFGLVLVIGIVVDDAIVVVENTTRHIQDGLPAREAAMKAMSEVSGAVIATTLVLLAVFVPTIFMGGITGMLFRQFAVTISIATVFSSINALTLSPALCGLLLRKKDKPSKMFGWFNTLMDHSTKGYVNVVRFALRKAVIGVMLFIGLTVGAIFGLGQLPTGFVPQEDEGYCLVSFQLPSGATLNRTQEVMKEINAIIDETPALHEYITIGGYSVLDGAVTGSAGFNVVTFKNWDERTTPETSMEALVNGLQQRLAKLQDCTVFVLTPPSLPGVGISGGFTYMLQDRGGTGLAELNDMANSIIEDGNAQTGLTGLNSQFRADIPQLDVEINREQVKKMGINLSSVFNTLQIFLGSSYVNDFNQFGKIYKVKAQADASFRSEPSDIGGLELKNAKGEMVPLSALADIQATVGPQTVTRFNVYPAIKILGQPSEGFSSGEALNIMESMSAQTLPPTMGYAWSELSLQEKLAAGGTTIIFILAVVLVYLVLSAQYESWTIPISVCLSVPTAILGAVLGCYIRGFDNNVYTQIGIVLLIGLATKSAILIAEFAKSERESGKSVFDAAMSAAKLRFRAVLMTAFSFILGVIPLMAAAGAGAVSRQVLGTVVFVGMLIATAASLVCVPMLYYIIQTVQEKFSSQPKEEGTAAES